MKSKTWWIETSRKWIVRAYGAASDEWQTDDFGELLEYCIWAQDKEFRQLAAEWNVSLEVLAELVADHIRRLE